MIPLVSPAIVSEGILEPPVYFSQVYVRADSRFRNFGDLQGSKLAYNCEASLSGFHCLKFFVQSYAEYDSSVSLPYFSDVLRTGGHKNSVQAVIDGRADLCSLDCNVLAELLGSEVGKEKMAQLRPIDIPSLTLKVVDDDGNAKVFSVSRDGLLGPNPGQPVVASTRLSPNQIKSIKQAFLEASEEVVPIPALRGRARYVEVSAEYYDPIVLMMRATDDTRVISKKMLSTSVVLMFTI